MPTVRSQRLLGHHFTAANPNSPAWVTPAGYTVIVKNLTGYNGSAAAGNLLVVLNISGVLSMQAANFSLASSAAESRDVYIVLNPGDVLYAYSATIDMYVWISGSVLTGAPTLPPASLTLAQAAVLASLLSGEPKPGGDSQPLPGV